MGGFASKSDVVGKCVQELVSEEEVKISEDGLKNSAECMVVIRDDLLTQFANDDTMNVSSC